MKRSLALVYVLGLFLLGIVIGGMGMHLYYAARLPGPPGLPGHPGPFHLTRMERALELTPEQRGRIEEILDESRDEFERLRAELRPRLREHMNRSHERIREVLTDAQRERFDEMWNSHRRDAERFLMRRRHGRRGPPP